MKSLNLKKTLGLATSIAGGLYLLKLKDPASAHPCMNERHTQDGGDTDTRAHGNKLIAAVTNIPDAKKRHRGGEDGFLLTRELIAVADGVGGWNRKGVDPGIFARELCGHVWNDYKSHKGKGDLSLRQLLVDAVAKTKATGTSTFAMALIDEQHAFLKTLNLGDSGFMIVRPQDTGEFEVLFRSKEQQYRFNYPYQCGTNYGPPNHADTFVHSVRNNDLVVLATDGVLDNLFNENIVDCLKKHIAGQLDTEVQLAATCIARSAELRSYQKDYDSPFAVNARAAGRSHPGGKKDDITVIVGKVSLEA